MANYLLPCSCGRRLSVTSAMSGERVRCECGAPIEVPTLRGLQQLERDEPSGPASSRRVWNERQRLTFALLVLGLAAGGVAGFLKFKMPPAPQRIVMPLEQSAIDASTPDQVHAAFEELKKGLQPPTNIITPEGRDALELRKRLTWGMRISLAVGACLLASGVLAMLLRPKVDR